jgi:hypothetical protein
MPRIVEKEHGYGTITLSDPAAGAYGPDVKLVPDMRALAGPSGEGISVLHITMKVGHRVLVR